MKFKISSLIPKEEFSKNVLTLVSGTAIAQIIPIAISPVLTRIYTPEEFGIYAILTSIVIIFSVISNGRYELAIVLPEKDEDAINIFALGLIINVVLLFFLSLIVYFFNDFIISKIGTQELAFWLYFAPLCVFFAGLFNLLKYYNIRKKYYEDISKATVIKSVVISVIQLSFGFLKFGVSGLINGYFFSQLFANIRLANNIFRDKLLLSKIKKSKLVELGSRYKKFPIFSVWGIFANTFSYNYLNILISTFYSINTLGFYSLSSRVLSAPLSLISTSVGQVFFQTASIEKNKFGNARKTFKSTFNKLLIIAIPFFSVLYFFIVDIFDFVYGPDWRVAGEYSKVLIPLFFIKFIVTPLSNINNIFELQKLALVWQVILMILSLSVIYMSDIFNLDFNYFLNIYVFVLLVHYLILFIILRKVSLKGKLF